MQADPTPAIVLLDRLRDDPSAFVRRSVANHLGDIVKDHPDLALAIAQRWRDEGGDHVTEVVRRGLRTLIKAGETYELTRRHRFAHASIRRLEPGEQVVEVQVNRRVHDRRTIELTG